MTMMNYFVLTAAERTEAMSHNGGNVAINPRAIDNSTPGVGINLNDNAVDFVEAAIVPLTGKYAAPKRIVDDAEYQQYAPEMITFILTLPWCSLETETIFAPEVP